ncbi:hypothetical protein ACH4E7_13240 [Kitasatospora sp. NPDC018058]|uniref:hypothetical protein n=1 Tax=Kitasatospora sp. NPDC018058 TaxID=3364025 RepID=UPI0037BF867A
MDTPTHSNTSSAEPPRAAPPPTGAPERLSFQSAYDEGLPAVRYLMRELELLPEHFSPHGVELLADLRHQTDQL